MLLNPRTLRCVRATGPTAKELVRVGNISQAEVRAAYYAGPFAEAYRRRATYRRPRNVTAQGTCPPGMLRNPYTRRCIRAGGKTFRQLYPGAAPPALTPLRPAPPPAPVPVTAAAPPPRLVESEGSATLPYGVAAPIPIAERDPMIRWTLRNCTNDRDPLTSYRFASLDMGALRQTVRLHDRTCTLSQPLHDHVRQAHARGAVASIPANPGTSMTYEDYMALRDTRRRSDPAYKLPARKHAPPPPTWKLYIASDTRSGPDYATVMYVDTTKARMGPRGPEYPPQSMVIDLGFLPMRGAPGAICSPQTLADIIVALDRANRLLVPVGGGWKPIAGLPIPKSAWEKDTLGKINRLCRDLTRALKQPF